MLDTSKIKRRYFKFTVEDTDAVIKKYIIPQYPNIKYTVQASLTTRSIYVVFYHKGRSFKVRLSDHKNYHSNLIYHYISRITRVPKVVRIFLHSIESLLKKETLDAKNKISSRAENSKNGTS